MKRLCVTVLLFGLTGCASLDAAKAPGCHGRREPANPHGSVLLVHGQAPAAPAPPASAPMGGCGGAR